MMSDVDDTTMKECDNLSKREIPAVPTPDWSRDNFKGPNIISLEKNHTLGVTESSVEMTNMSIIKSTSCTSATSGVNVIDMQKTFSSRTALEDVGSMKPSISRNNGDIPSTPTHITTTPIYNPHTTMAVATPAAASGVNQAINSIKLQNCVSTVNVGCDLKLLDIYCKTRYSEYNPQRFQGVVMKLMDPRATALIFKSGKIVCTGARNEYDSYIAARKFARIIERLGFPTKFMDFKIQNFCATADLKFPIRLEALQQAHGQFASYEPELFPGLVYRMVRPRVVLLIFVNGKIVFTGGKNRNEITEALEIIYPILRGYRIS